MSGAREKAPSSVSQRGEAVDNDSPGKRGTVPAGPSSPDSPAGLSDVRRLTPTERLHEVTMAAMARRPSEPESSVSISRNAKGVAQFEVTVRGPDPADCESEAINLFSELERLYPYPAANGGTAE